MWSNQLYSSFLPESFVELVAVIRLVANEAVWELVDEALVERALDGLDFIGRSACWANARALEFRATMQLPFFCSRCLVYRIGRDVRSEYAIPLGRERPSVNEKSSAFHALVNAEADRSKCGCVNGGWPYIDHDYHPTTSREHITRNLRGWSAAIRGCFLVGLGNLARVFLCNPGIVEQLRTSRRSADYNRASDGICESRYTLGQFEGIAGINHRLEVNIRPLALAAKHGQVSFLENGKSHRNCVVRHIPPRQEPSGKKTFW